MMPWRKETGAIALAIISRPRATYRRRSALERPSVGNMMGVYLDTVPARAVGLYVMRTHGDLDNTG